MKVLSGVFIACLFLIAVPCLAQFGDDFGDGSWMSTRTRSERRPSFSGEFAVLPRTDLKEIALEYEQAEKARLEIRKKLAEKATLELDESHTFEDLFTILKEKHGVQAVLDPKGAGALGFAVSSPIVREPFSLENVSLGRLLRLILDENDLTYVVDENFLLITSQDEERRFMSVRAYSVADLVTYAVPQELTRKEYDPKTKRWNTVSETVDCDFGELIELIESVVLPESWSSNGGDGEMMEHYQTKLLIVLQTDRVHEEIEKLLQIMRVENEKQMKNIVVRPETTPKKRPERQHGGFF